jgi:uncharacterized membrane protein
VHHLPPSQIIYAAPLTPHIQPVKKINWTGCIVQGCLPMVGGSHAQVLEAVVLPVVLLLLVCALLLYVQCCQHLSMPLLS